MFSRRNNEELATANENGDSSDTETDERAPLIRPSDGNRGGGEVHEEETSDETKLSPLSFQELLAPQLPPIKTCSSAPNNSTAKTSSSYSSNMPRPDARESSKPGSAVSAKTSSRATPVATAAEAPSRRVGRVAHFRQAHRS